MLVVNCKNMQLVRKSSCTLDPILDADSPRLGQSGTASEMREASLATQCSAEVVFLPVLASGTPEHTLATKLPITGYQKKSINRLCTSINLWC